MRYTPIYRLPALESTETAKDIYEQSWDVVTKLEAALLASGNPPVGADLQTLLKRTNDTGWITIVRAGQTTGDGFRAETNVQARKIGFVVYLSGRVNRDSAPSAAVLMTMPSDMRPGNTIYAPGVLGWAQTTTFYSAGTVQLGANIARPTGSSGYPLDGISYVTG